MRGLLCVLWVLFVIVPNKCESFKDVDLFRTRRQALDQSALPESYTIFPDHNVAYKIYKEKLAWDAARGKCKSDGGDLAIALREDTIQFIQGLLDPSWKYYMWVGAYKPAGSLIWRTPDGTPLSIEAMPWNAPNSSTGQLEDCSANTLYKSKVYYAPCTKIHPFVCEILILKHQRDPKVTTTTPVTTTSTSTLPPPSPSSSSPLQTITATSDNSSLQTVEFSRLGILYKFHGDRLTHHEARKGCFADGGRLAVVDSFEKINVISKILNEEPVHVGIRVSSVNFGEWVGDSNGEPLKDLPWTANNPHPARCAALRKDGSGLEETLCSNKLQYLCEIRKITE